MNTYFVSTSSTNFFSVSADEFEVEDDTIYFISEGICFLTIFQHMVFSIEGLGTDHDTHILWTGEKYKRYQRSRHIGKV